MWDIWGGIESGRSGMHISSGKRLQLAIENGPFIVDLPIKDGDFP